MAKEIRNARQDDPETNTQNGDQSDGQELEVRQTRNLDLGDLADRMDGHSRTRAVERILAHHAALRSDIDRLCAKVGSQAETIAQLESRLALVEGNGEGEEEGAKGKRRGASAKEKEVTPAPVDYAKPENDRRLNHKKGFFDQKLYFGSERRGKKSASNSGEKSGFSIR